ncbi:MAG TPA: hypothetical protein VJT81_06780 [Burkholderiales bacterium]|nr:hypothetical protein [Burkholderiales bacterium]
MGQAKLKKEKPTVFVGPRGNKYYCRNRCGRVAYTKDNNQIFTERPHVPGFGWCGTCIMQAKAAAEAKANTAVATTDVDAELAAAAAARAAALKEMEGR